MTLFLAIPFPPRFAKKFLTVKNVPTPRQPYLNPVTIFPILSFIFSNVEIVLFRDSIFSAIFSGESFIPLFSIPILKPKLAFVSEYLILGITETLASFFRLTF